MTTKQTTINKTNLILPSPHAVMSNVYNNNMQMEEFGKG